MQAVKHERSWKVSVDARSSGLRFKLKVAKVSPGLNFDRISLLLRLRKFVFNLTAGSKPSLPSPLHRLKRSTDCKSRFRRAFQKLRSRRFNCSQPVSASPQQPTSSKIPESKFLGNPFKRILFEDPTRGGCYWAIAILVAIIGLLWRFPRDSSWERTIQYFLGHAFTY